ncbi:MAG: nucleoside triphosphate pyrophosphohydrolase [Bdellovibrionota bacterium]|nr:nucleoside triphosphate pyrophosphohydrolase [Bdellovibrionota bacterium]
MENKEFNSLKEVVKKLRDPKDGCPWDLKQTHLTLLPYLIEESFEFINAVESKDIVHMKEELGDILLQVLLHATISEQEGSFEFEDICKTLKEKLIKRHPHVFKEKDPSITAEQVSINWKKIKEQEKKESKEKTLISDDVLKYPSMLSALKIGKLTENIGFDWEDYNQVSWKVEEEWQELKEELAPATISRERVKEEVGDLLFSTVQLARHLEIDPEQCLRESNHKFIKRFRLMESLISDSGYKIEELNQKEMDHFWDKAKKQ